LANLTHICTLNTSVSYSLFLSGELSHDQTCCEPYFEEVVMAIMDSGKTFSLPRCASHRYLWSTQDYFAFSIEINYGQLRRHDLAEVDRNANGDRANLEHLWDDVSILFLLVFKALFATELTIDDW